LFYLFSGDPAGNWIHSPICVSTLWLCKSYYPLINHFQVINTNYSKIACVHCTAILTSPMPERNFHISVCPGHQHHGLQWMVYIRYEVECPICWEEIRDLPTLAPCGKNSKYTIVFGVLTEARSCLLRFMLRDIT
jgi:hypothetical protein